MGFIKIGGGSSGGGGTGLSHGTQELYIPLGDGVRPSAGQTTNSWNNHLAAVRFDHYGTPTESDHAIARFPLPQLSGYTGGDITFRVYFSLTVTGGAGDAAKFKFKLALNSQSDVFPTSYNTEYINLVDLENIPFNTMQYFDFTIPAADWDIAKQMVNGQLERMNSDVQDTFSGATSSDFDHRVYVHSFRLVYQGWGIEPNMDAP